MSQRRMDQISGNGQQWYTIFVIGLKSRSLPVLYALYGHLISLGLVPTNRQHLYFTHGGRRVNWTDTMQSLGLGPLSHLQMRVIVPGGANAEAGSSRRPGQYKDSTRMADILAAEGVDEFGNPEKAKTSVKRKRKAKKPVNSDPEDEDFATSEESESEDNCRFPPFSHSSEECPGAGREIGRKISATQKKAKKKDDPPAAPANSANAPPAEGPSTRKQQRGGKRNVIYLFFEDVEAAGDGSMVDGSCYYKCYLGNREIIEVPKSANYNISILSKRTEPPTELERDLARNEQVMTAELASEYKSKCDQIDGNIKAMLQKQAADAQWPNGSQSVINPS
ncbi:hypothetical protein B0H13DRAFT_1865636 [Mycena leptocephala]|nr:hypothetical protein B0H13DRAFT_1865636 [Mycena leptocephala]